MPAGRPSAAVIVSQQVAGFALDTNVIRGVGYRFESAPLSLLNMQLPPWMRLYFPDVIMAEVVRQQTDSLFEHVEAIRAEVKAIERAGFDTSTIDGAINQSAAIVDSSAIFQRRVEAFVQRHRGNVLKEDAGLADELFLRYFSGVPPFGNSKARKHEFPDAAALLTLEGAAKRLKTNLIAVSDDKAWSDFAAASDWIYCVPSLDALTKLFVSGTQHAKKIEERLIAMLEGKSNTLLDKIESQLIDRLPDSSWTVDAYTGISARLDPEVTHVRVEWFEPDAEGIRLWMSPDDHERCVVEVEITAHVEVEVSAEFFVTDPIDKDELSAGHGTNFVQKNLEITGYLTLFGDLLSGDPKDWDIELEIFADRIHVDAGEMRLDYSADYEE